MKKLFLLFLFGITVGCMKSQVSISNSTAGAKEPNQAAILDLQSTDKGLLLPRVSLTSTSDPSPLTSHVAGMTVYNSKAAGEGSNAVFVGLYYNDGTKWVSMPLSYTKWFYMPSIPFETSNSLTLQTKDLYQEYIKQFGGDPQSNTRFKGSEGAPSTIPHLPSATDLYYYVTDYDPAVFSNISINASGVMTYDVTAAATDQTFINIIFVLK